MDLKISPIFPYFEEAKNSEDIFCLFRTAEGITALHGHDYYELECILDGYGTQWINNVAFEMSPGSLYLLSPEDEHRLIFETPTRLISIHFNAKAASKIGIDFLREAYSIHFDQAHFFLFQNLFSECIAKKATSNQTRWLLGVTTLLVSCLLENGQKYPSFGGSRQIQTALHYIQENYHDPNLSLKEVSAVCELSLCHFSVKFHEYVGIGFAKYLSFYRLQRVCLLLLEQSLTVTEIALQCGFSSMSHFYRLFHNTYGCTPKEYPQKYQNEPAGE